MSESIRIGCSATQRQFNEILQLVSDGKFATTSSYILHILQCDLEQRRTTGEFDAKE